MIQALEQTLGVVSPACKKAKIGRTQYYNWLKEDEDFANAVKDIENISLDFVETQHYKQIKEGNVASIIFHLKTKGRKRGYQEKQEIEHTGNMNFNGIVIE